MSDTFRKYGTFDVMEAGSSVYIAAEGIVFLDGSVAVRHMGKLKEYANIEQVTQRFPGAEVQFRSDETQRILSRTRQRSRELMDQLRTLPGWSDNNDEDFADKVRNALRAQGVQV